MNTQLMRGHAIRDRAHPIRYKGALVLLAMRGVSLTSCIFCAALLFFFLNRPGTADGQDLGFLPQLIYSEAYLQLDASSVDNEAVQNGTGSKASSEVLGERINLLAEGFVYHPKFLLFLTKFSGGLNQQSVNGFGKNDTTLNYEIRTKIFPQHPLTLELFKLHTEAYNPAAPTIVSLSGSVDQQGAELTYKILPFIFRAGYVENDVNSRTSSAHTQSYHMSGTYNDRLQSDDASYLHSETASSLGSLTVRDDYNFLNTLHFTDIRLDSIVNEIKLEQTAPLLPSFKADTFSWNENLTAPLPWNLTTRASYAYRDENSRTDETSGPPDEFNRFSTATFGLTHHLYQSLVTNLTIIDHKMNSTHGDFQTNTDLFSSTYYKTIPYGKLTMGVQLGSSETDHQGAPSIIDEIHSAALLTTFSLAQTNIVLSSIVVQVKDPVAGTLITLPQSDFLSAQIGNTVQITVVSVFPMTPQAPGFIYEFHVSYSLVSDQSTIKTTFAGYTFKTDLFENLASVYYNYGASRQDVTSGSVLGVADRTLLHVIGATVYAGSYSGLIEYQDFESRMTPYTSKKTSLQYQQPVSDDTSMSADITYTATDYPSPSDHPETPAYRVNVTQTDLMTASRFPREHLAFLLTASYNMTRSVWDSNSLIASTNVTWESGLISISGGAQINQTETTTTTSKTTLLSQYYYVILTRKLF